jgi:hypothetical protein
LSSPIVTNAEKTKTWSTNGEVIAVARRDHLCAAISRREDHNRADRQRDAFGWLRPRRCDSGAAEPAALFYRGDLENICVSLAQQEIDAKVNPKQPGVKIWSSTMPDVAVNDFVSILMGSPPRTIGHSQ